MKKLIIIGAGGMGRQVSLFAKACTGYQKEYVIKGFLDDNPNAMVGFEEFPPLLGSVDNYEIQPDDIFFNSIGDVAAKKKCITKILDRGGEFITLIHPTAIISEGTKIGCGCMISCRAGIGTETEIGDFCLIQDNAIIGHDVKVGNFCRIDCNVVLIAGVKLDDGVCVHTSSVINHNVHIGMAVQGNPAKRIVV